MRRLQFVLILSTASVAWAQGNGPQPPDAKPERQPEAQASGTLVAVDAAANKVVVKREAGEETFRTDDKTQVLVDDTKAALAGLTVNSAVRVAYLKDGQPPYLALRIYDAKTIAVLDAELVGVAAKIDAIETKGEGEAKVVTITVTTAQGKQRALRVVAAGPQGSQIWRDGKPADASAFKVGDQVTVSIRRGEKALRLKGLADPVTFAAFLAMRTLQGKVSAIDTEKRSFTLTPDSGAAQTVHWTRNTGCFTAGAKHKGMPFKDGDAVVVKFELVQKKVVQARAIFAPESWQAYGQAAIQPAP
ncbi:MAG: hypothetical protein IT204_24610 [Fimbriimonadaceae bacterium]|nr:hypothetical protein [Fimbriimonadaceae bacterium]